MVNDKSFTLSPVTDAKVLTGRPIAPKAVGVVLAIRQIIAAKTGLNPNAARILAGMATAVPKPAIASKKPPKPQAKINTRIR